MQLTCMPGEKLRAAIVGLMRTGVIVDLELIGAVLLEPQRVGLDPQLVGLHINYKVEKK